MEFFPFNVEARTNQFVGSSGARKCRLLGYVPANFCFKNGKSQSIRVKRTEIEGLFGKTKTKNPLINVVAPKSDYHGKRAICRYVELDPLTQKITHLEFYEINANEKIEVTVPVHVIGKTPDASLGAIIEIVAHELVVECLPSRIPAFIEVDVSNLHKGNAIHVEEMRLPEGVEYAGEAHVTVVSCHMPHLEPEKADTTTTTPEVVGEAGAEGAAPVEAAAANAGAGKKEAANS